MIVFEASGSAYFVSKALKNMEYYVITVAHPKEIWCITKSEKSDRTDLLKLAKLHLVGMIPKYHFLDPKDRIFLSLIIQRVKLGRCNRPSKKTQNRQSKIPQIYL